MLIALIRSEHRALKISLVLSPIRVATHLDRVRHFRCNVGSWRGVSRSLFDVNGRKRATTKIRPARNVLEHQAGSQAGGPWRMLANDFPPWEFHHGPYGAALAGRPHGDHPE